MSKLTPPLTSSSPNGGHRKLKIVYGYFWIISKSEINLMHAKYNNPPNFFGSSSLKHLHLGFLSHF
jgi:hypothetical protein